MRKSTGIYAQPYPYNLLDKLFGDGYSETKPATDDRMLAIEHVITKCLTHREQFVIEHRFQQHALLAEIAELLSISAERVRQIETKALFKLRKPIPKNVIDMGYRAFYSQDIEQLHKTKQALLNQDLAVYAYPNMDWGGPTYRLEPCDMTVIHGANIHTVNDLLTCTSTTFRSKLRDDARTALFRIVNHIRKQIVELDAIIAVLETEATPHEHPSESV